MTSIEPQRSVAEASTTDDDASATAPLIVNGLTVRPREKVNLWRYGILFLPDFAALLVIAGLGMRWLFAISRRQSKTVRWSARSWWRLRHNTAGLNRQTPD